MTPAQSPQQTKKIEIVAPWGCKVESTMAITGKGRMDFNNLTRHKVGESVCKCPRPNPEDQIAEEEKLARHVHGLWNTGKCNSPEKMIEVFSKLKLGLPVAEEHQLHWDEESKTFGKKEPREPEDQNVASDFKHIFSAVLN
ncbi:hypothetical protein F5Y08DRAFT_352302 [Xylaria arbuscula]|nr:hypothetical protein F5Y08DRAFT_352302 [Xylaria arbuscula]